MSPHESPLSADGRIDPQPQIVAKAAQLLAYLESHWWKRFIDDYDVYRTVRGLLDLLAARSQPAPSLEKEQEEATRVDESAHREGPCTAARNEAIPAVLQSIERAQRELAAMCERQWSGNGAIRWSIPAREGDSDLIIAAALAMAHAAITERSQPAPASGGQPTTEGKSEG